MKVLLIDHDDSFTGNLAQQIGALGADCIVRSHRALTLEKIRSVQSDRIVLSAGPGHPRYAVLAYELLQSYLHPSSRTPTPVLGVCLGHQCMALAFGGSSCVSHASEVRHGKTSVMHHSGTGIFTGIPSPFQAARYHSLIVKMLPKDFELLCWTDTQQKPDAIMAMRHRTFPMIGVQFHPESFLTEYGDHLMKNFLKGSW